MVIKPPLVTVPLRDGYVDSYYITVTTLTQIYTFTPKTSFPPSNFQQLTPIQRTILII